MSGAAGRPLPARLRPDCARCCGLCCVAPAFDAGQDFGHDKPASEPCRHLQADHRCSIHADLVRSGYPGCASFDCFGAGQQVTQRHAGRSWRESEQLAARMFESYARLRPLHELQAMTQLALDRADQPETARALQELLARLVQLCDTDTRIDALGLRRQVQQEIRALMGRQGRS